MDINKEYNDFLNTKKKSFISSGFDIEPSSELKHYFSSEQTKFNRSINKKKHHEQTTMLRHFGFSGIEIAKIFSYGKEKK